MANRDARFLIKRSNVPGKIPTNGDLLLGELGLNTADAILYTSGTTANSILPIGWDRVSRTGDTMTGGLFTPYLSATTVSATTYLNLPTFTGDYLPLSGGTVYGPTIYSSGLTANTLNVTGLTQTSGITSTGGITFKQVTISSSYTATTSDYMIDASGGTFTVSLPSAVGIQGRLLVIKNNGGGAVTVDPYNSELIDDKSFVILGESNVIQLVSNGSNWIALSYNISTVNSSTGVFSFTGITTASPTTFTVAPVKGWIVDDTTNPLSPQLYYVAYSGGTHTATYVTTATETWVYLTSGGTISQSNIPLTDQQRRQNIALGKLGHANKTSIINSFSQPDFVLSPLSQLRDMFEPINLINAGIRPSANGVNLSFNTSAGYLHGLGINFANDTLNPNAIYVTGTSPCTFQYRTQTGGTASNTTFIDPTKYDVGGVVTSLSGTKATNQRIYLVQNGVFRVQYGQTEYSNLTQAIAGISSENFVEFSNFENNGILVGILSVLSSATDLSDTSKAQFFNVSKFGDSAGAAGGSATTTLQQAYNNSTTPEITTNSILGALSIKNGAGTADNVTSLFEGQTATNGVTSIIRADGYISGTTLHTSGFTANSTGISATTVSATTIFTSGFTANTTGLSATTVSATTYYNLPTDIRVTGGTYSSGSATFTNNTGGTFTVTGFSTSTATAFTGGTVTGATNFTGGLTANTISATTYSNLPTDIRVTGATYSNNTFTYTNNTGGTFNVLFNTVTGLTVNGNLTVTGGTQSLFSGSSSVEMVKIIQAGSGDAFVVEDQANGDASHFVINASGNTAIGLTQPLGSDKLTVSGNTSISGNLSVSGNTTLSGSGSSILTVIGSGTTTPIFSVQGSSGELFSVTDSLIGSLFSVNDISGLPIIEVFSDNTILMGNYLAPSLNTTAKISLTAGTNTIYSIPTSAYTGAFVDYTVINSGNTSARAGNIMTIWNSGSTQYTEVSTNDIGSTTGISFSTSLSGSNALISASATTAGWTLKTIIRAI